MVQASAVALPAPAATIPLREILPWAIFAFALAFVAMYFVGIEEGAFSFVNSNVVHEFVHDARHLAGLPCH